MGEDKNCQPLPSLSFIVFGGCGKTNPNEMTTDNYVEWSYNKLTKRIASI